MNNKQDRKAKADKPEQKRVGVVSYIRLDGEEAALKYGRSLIIVGRLSAPGRSQSGSGKTRP